MVKFRSGPGQNFKRVTCIKTKEEVTRRKSLAINHKGDGAILGKGKNGKSATCALPCQRITRKAIKPIIRIETPESRAISKIIDKQQPKKVSKVEKAQMQRLLEKKNASKKMDDAPRGKM
jgi:hypothetical protein